MNLSKRVRSSSLTHALPVFSAAILSLIAIPARADILSNGSFALGTNSFMMSYDPTGVSSNFTGPGYNNLVIPGWSVTTDGIGCVVVAGTVTTNGSPGVCGLHRFSGSAFNSDPGAVPGGGNYILIDGAPGTPNTTTLYQPLSGLTPGQNYTVDFWQASAQFKASSGAATTEQWTVSFDTAYGAGACDPTVLQNATVGVDSCESQMAPLMTTAAGGATPWQEVSMTFLAHSNSEILGFFAQGAPDTAPPIVLLGNVSVTGAPEPATYGLIGTGLLGLLAFRRQRRTRELRSR